VHAALDDLTAIQKKIGFLKKNLDLLERVCYLPASISLIPCGVLIFPQSMQAFSISARTAS
jgi:hypothetical protein